MADSTWKDAPHYMSLWNCKLKQYKIPLYTYQNGQNPEYRQHQMLARMKSNRNSQSLLVGMQNSAATLEYWGFPTKLNIPLSSDPEIPLLCICLMSSKLLLHKNLHVIFFSQDVYSSFVHNCQNLEAGKKSFSKWIDKLRSIQSMEYAALKRSVIKP